MGFPSVYTQLSDESLHKQVPWLDISATPQESWKVWRNLIKVNTPLSCNDDDFPHLQEVWNQITALPQNTLPDWNNAIKDHLQNSCENKVPLPVPYCRFSEIFAALAADQLWNDYYFAH